MLKYDAGRWLQIHTCLSYEYSMMLCINNYKLTLYRLSWCWLNWSHCKLRVGLSNSRIESQKELNSNSWDTKPAYAYALSNGFRQILILTFIYLGISLCNVHARFTSRLLLAIALVLGAESMPYQYDVTLSGHLPWRDVTSDKEKTHNKEKTHHIIFTFFLIYNTNGSYLFELTAVGNPNIFAGFATLRSDGFDSIQNTERFWANPSKDNVLSI